MAAPRNINIKKHILKAAINLLQSRPFNDITLAGIAKEAHISKGTLYYYYSNKDDILFDITDAYLTKLAEDLIIWLDNKEKDTSLPRLIRFVMEKGGAENLGNLRLHLAGAAISGNSALCNKYVEKYQYFQNTLKESIIARAPKADGEYLAWLILTAMDGMLIQQQLKNPAFNRKDYMEKTVKMILREV